MRKHTILWMAACLLAGLTTLAGCQKMPFEEEPADPSELGASADSLWTLTVEATKEVPGQAGDDIWGVAGDDSWGVAGEGTKALDLVNDGARLNAYWKNTETVKVLKAGSFLGSLSVQPGDGTKPASATLSGGITTTNLAVDDELTLLIPRDIWDYTGQKGTLTGTGAVISSVEETYDYALATVKVKAIDGNSVTTTHASFQNQQSIYRFSFRNSGSALSVKSFIVSAANGQLVRSRAYSGGWTPTFGSLTVTPTSATAEPLYVSLRNESTVADTYSFVITGSDDKLYLASRPVPVGVLDVPGKFISATDITATLPDFSPNNETTDTAY